MGMRRTALLLASAALAMLLASGVAFAQASGQLDQENAPSGGVSWALLDHDHMAHQSFAVGRDGFLDGVDLFVDFQRVSNDNPVSVAIVDGTGRGVVCNDGAPFPETAEGGEWVHLPCPQLKVNAGDTWRITLLAPDNQNPISWAHSGDTYGGGMGWIYGGSPTSYQDINGDFLFRTYVSPDLTGPLVATTFPAAGSTNATSHNGIQIEFSEAIARDTATASTIKVYRYARKAARWRPVTIEVLGGFADPTVEDKYVFIDATPSDDNGGLRPKSRYKVVVTPGVEDLYDNQLDQRPDLAGNQSKVWKFTTSGV